MATPKRRKLEFDISEIREVSPQAVVRGVITELSPIRDSPSATPVKYFNGKITDGRKTIRLVSFGPKHELHTGLLKARAEGSSVEITNCQVKESSGSSVSSPVYEIFLSPRSEVRPSSAKFTLPEKMEEIDPDISTKLDSLDCIETVVTKLVPVVGKVTNVTMIQTRDGKVLNKQDCTLSDSSKTVLWGDDVEKLKQGLSYELENVTIKVYDGVKYLSLSRRTVKSMISKHLIV